MEPPNSQFVLSGVLYRLQKYEVNLKFVKKPSSSS